MEATLHYTKVDASNWKEKIKDSTGEASEYILKEQESEERDKIRAEDWKGWMMKFTE